MESLIDTLEHNGQVILTQLVYKSREEYRYKPSDDQWCMLEVLCHLIDEEVLDFRSRTASVLDDPLKALTPYDPIARVMSERYADQRFDEKLLEFRRERERSLAWLRNLDQPNWQNSYDHLKLGPMSAELFLNNWVAHDLIHIRQINRLAYAFLKSRTSIDLSYAGNFKP